jgi:hypothetical protein
VQHNLNLAISKALQFCNIPGLMDVDDFVAAGGPDEASLMTYLAEFLKYYRKKWGRKGFMPAHNRYALPPSGAATASLSGSPAKRTTAGWEIKYKDLRIDKEIGRGAFGQVFKGSWRMQPVAIKQLLISGEKMTESELAEFMGECELMMTLRPHKNVVLLLGVCCDPAQPFCLVTDFQANGSLHTLLKSDREIGWETTLRVLEGVAAGMYHIHEEKICIATSRRATCCSAAAWTQWWPTLASPPRRRAAPRRSRTLGARSSTWRPSRCATTCSRPRATSGRLACSRGRC